MNRKELAAMLGISGAMVTKLAKRGMPVDDFDKAMRWRKRHLEWTRTKGVRVDAVTPAPPPPLGVATARTIGRERPFPESTARPTNRWDLALEEVVTNPTFDMSSNGFELRLVERLANLAEENFSRYADALRLCMQSVPIEDRPRVRLPACVWVQLVGSTAMGALAPEFTAGQRVPELTHHEAIDERSGSVLYELASGARVFDPSATS